jgi:hypothetical protein
MIKVSFSGFAGSGKTSLMNEVKKILSLKWKVDTIEQLKGKNPFDNDKKSCFASQFFYITNQINEENTKAIGPLDYLLCDQSVLDQWIYWKHYLSGKEMNPALEEKNNVLRDIYRFWISTYDLIFVTRLDFNELDKRVFDNDLRIPDTHHVKKTDELFDIAVKEDGLKVFDIWNNNSIDESSYEVLRIISEYKGKEGKERKEGKEDVK